MSPHTLPSITVNVFSGRRSPHWLLQDHEATKLRRILSALPAAGPRGPMAPPDRTGLAGRPVTGYRGLEIAFPKTAASPAETYTVYGRAVLEESTGRVLEDGESTRLEEQIYRRAAVDVQKLLGRLTLDDLMNQGSESLIRNLDGPHVRLRCDAAPKFPGHTGGWKRHTRDNNCYNYGTNVLNASFDPPAIPGTANQSEDVTLAQLAAALLEDRLRPVGMASPSECPEAGTHYVAVVFRTHPSGVLHDFHCLRLDRSGRWSHKDGKDPVRKADDVGNEMTDLTRVALKWRPELVGIYLMSAQHRGRIG